MPADHDTRGDAARASAYADADAAIRRAEAELQAMFGGGGAATPPPPPPPRTSAVPEPSRPEPPSSAASQRPARPLRRRIGGLAITLAFVPIGLVGSAALVGACGSGSDGATATLQRAVGGSDEGSNGPRQAFRASDARAAVRDDVSVVAHIPARRVQAYVRPRATAKHKTVRAGTLDGAKLPLVMLVKQRRRHWLQVYLPTRPNLSKAWIRRSGVTLRQNPWRAKIELRKHRLSVFRGPKLVMRKPIGVGKSLTPTPKGQYYLTDLIKPRDPGGTYGPYAFGLSGHSPVLTSFAGGDGQLGLHGTNDPGALGTDVSHGCIRVRNGVIRRLARTLPLGTPLAIRS